MSFSPSPLPALPDPSVTLEDVDRSHVLQNRAFVRLWIGQIFAHPAIHILYFSLFLQTYEITQSNFLVSVLLVIVSAPPILFGSLAGVLADHMNRKIVLILSNLFRAALAILLFILPDNLTVILITAFFLSVLTNFFQPTENASVPIVARPHQLFLANTFYLFTVYTAIFLGYASSGPLLAFFGHNVFLFSAILFTLAFMTNLFLPPLRVNASEASDGELFTWKKIRTAFREGFVYLRNHPVLLFTLCQVVFVFSMERAIIALVPDLIHRVLDITIEQFSIMIIAPLGFGAICGAIAGNFLQRRMSKRKIVNQSLLIHAVIMILLPLPWSFPEVLAFFGPTLSLLSISLLAYLSGFVDVMIIIAAQTLLHEQASHDHRGRVVGNAFALMNALGIPVILGVGLLSSRILATEIISLIGVLTFLAALSGTVISRRLEHPHLTPERA